MLYADHPWFLMRRQKDLEQLKAGAFGVDADEIERLVAVVQQQFRKREQWDYKTLPFSD